MTRAYPLACPDVPAASAPSFIYSSPCPGGRGLLTATPFKFRRLDELASREDAEVSEILDDPVGAACRHAIRHLGEHLYELARDTDIMSDVLEQVVDRDPSRYSLRATIIDKSWNGIGAGQDRWWS